eukprot:5564837-Prymnesium_polylepis.1
METRKPGDVIAAAGGENMSNWHAQIGCSYHSAARVLHCCSGQWPDTLPRRHRAKWHRLCQCARFGGPFARFGDGFVHESLRARHP